MSSWSLQPAALVHKAAFVYRRFTVCDKFNLENATHLISGGIHINKGNNSPLQGVWWAEQSEKPPRRHCTHLHLKHTRRYKRDELASVTGSYFWSSRMQKHQKEKDAVLSMWVSNRKCRWSLTTRPFTSTWFFLTVHVTVLSPLDGST